MHTHIEPLAEAGQARRPVGVEAATAHGAIREAAREVTGADPKDVRLIRDGRGVVALVTIGLPGDQTLGDAHTKAAEVERLARGRAPDVVEVIVHTEPA